MSTNLLVTALAAAAIAAGLSGCSRSGEPEAGGTPPTVDVQATTLAERPFDPVVEAPGVWHATGEIVISAPFAAVVDSLVPRVGDSVERGTHIGWLVTRESQAAVRGAEMLLQQARDSSEKNEATRALAFARHDRVRVPLVAGAAGVVSRRDVEPGQEVADGAELLAVVPLATLMFEAHVPAMEAARVAPGLAVNIAIEGMTDIPAVVRTRVPASDSTDQSVRFWLAPRAVVPPALIDRFGRARIATGRPRRAIAVPDSAVVEDDLTGEHRVAVVKDSVAVWTTVRLGVAESGWHELLAPALPPGTRLVTSGQRGLPDHTRIRIRP